METNNLPCEAEHWNDGVFICYSSFSVVLQSLPCKLWFCCCCAQRTELSTTVDIRNWLAKVVTSLSFAKSEA